MPDTSEREAMDLERRYWQALIAGDPYGRDRS